MNREPAESVNSGSTEQFQDPSQALYRTSRDSLRGRLGQAAGGGLARLPYVLGQVGDFLRLTSLRTLLQRSGMETPKQQFNPRASGTLLHLWRDRTGVRAVRLDGLPGRADRARRAGMRALGRYGARGKLKPGSAGCARTPTRWMRTARPERPRLPCTGLTDAANAVEPAYPRYNRGAGEGLRPFEPQQTPAPVDCAGGGVAPVPPVTARPDG